MSLPFLQPKKIVSVIVARRGKSSMEVNPEVSAPGSEMDMGLKEAATDLLRALDEKSPLGVASALKAAFEILDSSEPEQEPEDGAHEA